MNFQTPQSLLIDEIIKNVPNDYNSPSNYSQEHLELFTKTVGLTVSSAKEVCMTTMEQSKDPRWYVERAKRVTASVFGKVIN